MTPFEAHMRKYHPDSTTARLSREVEKYRKIVADNEERDLEYLREACRSIGGTLELGPRVSEEPK